MKGKLAWFVATASLVAMGTIHASTFADAVDIARLSSEASGAYVATVTGLSTEEVDASHIKSTATLRVDYPLFGEASEGDTLMVAYEGGTLGDRVETLSNTPRFHPSERVLVFVEAAETAETGMVEIVEDALGKLSILTDPYTGRDMVRPTGQWANPPDPGGAHRAPSVPGTWPLETVIARIPQAGCAQN